MKRIDPRLVMQKAHLAVLFGTALLLVFVLLSLWGLFDISRLGWCDGRLLSCPQAREVAGHSFACAFVSALTAMIAALVLQERALQSAKSAVFLGLAIAALLVISYPLSLNLRSAVAAQYFPYNTAIRFGPLGFYSAWITVNIIVVVVVFCAARLARRLRERT
jgi:hypothetical protein